jgi:hypothetical protein
MAGNPEGEFAARIRLQQLSKLQRLRAQETRGARSMQWVAPLGVPLASAAAILLVRAGYGLLGGAIVATLASLLLVSIQILGTRVAAIVRILELSGAFELPRDDKGQTK